MKLLAMYQSFPLVVHFLWFRRCVQICHLSIHNRFPCSDTRPHEATSDCKLKRYCLVLLLPFHPFPLFPHITSQGASFPHSHHIPPTRMTPTMWSPDLPFMDTPEFIIDLGIFNRVGSYEYPESTFSHIPRFGGSTSTYYKLSPYPLNISFHCWHDRVLLDHPNPQIFTLPHCLHPTMTFFYPTSFVQFILLIRVKWSLWNSWALNRPTARARKNFKLKVPWGNIDFTQS